MQTEKVYPSDNSLGKRSLDGRSAMVQTVRAAEARIRLRPPFEPTSHEKATRLRQLAQSSRGVGAGIQCSRLLSALRELGEVSRMEAERFLGIGHAPRRILDLEEAGHLIGKRWVRQLSEVGSEHKTVSYSLNYERQLSSKPKAGEVA